MRIRSIVSTISLLALSSVALADLMPYKDYEVSDAVWSVTTVKVDANMGDAYLEGLRKTWAASSAVAEELGHIESWSIFRSDLPRSGEFNLLLIVKFANTADLAPNQKRYDAFMKAWGDENGEMTSEYAQKNYPGMRTITGEYMMREVTFK